LVQVGERRIKNKDNAETRSALRAAESEAARLFCFGFLEGFLDRFFGEGAHDGVALGVGVQAVLAEVGFEEAVFVDGGGEIVEIDVAVGGGVLLDPIIEFDDFCGLALDAHVDRFAIAIVAVIADGEHAGEDDTDFVGVGEFVHRLEIALDLFDGHRAGIAGEVVGTGENEDDFRLQRDDVGTEADEHLRRGLSADAAVDVGLAGKEAAVFGADPGVGDGVAHEDDALFVFRGRFNGGVCVVVAGEIGPVLERLLGGGEFGGEFGAVAGLGRGRGSLRVDCGSGEKNGCER
jgi:hypothetical protein